MLLCDGAKAPESREAGLRAAERREERGSGFEEVSREARLTHYGKQGAYSNFVVIRYDYCGGDSGSTVLHHNMTALTSDFRKPVGGE